MARFIQAGNTLDYVPGTTAPAGTVVKIGADFFGVALRDIPAGDLGALAINGVFAFPKAEGSIAVGTPCYWDEDSATATTTATAGEYLGRAVAATTGTEVCIALNGKVAVIAQAVEDAGDSNIKTQFNALLASLRSAGILAQD